MMLLMDFPKNMVTEDLLGQAKIPCLCRVSEKFEVHFFDTVPESDGLIVQWDRRELELRAVPGVGGEYSHHALGLITIRPVSVGKYEVVDLELFSSMFGWCPVLISGQYAPPGDFWDKEQGCERALGTIIGSAGGDRILIVKGASITSQVAQLWAEPDALLQAARDNLVSWRPVAEVFTFPVQEVWQ